MAAPEAESPRWWIERLYKKLQRRTPEIALYDRYYSGDHPLPWLPRQIQDEFRNILRMTRSNYMGLVVDAKAERLMIEGFRVDNGDDPDAGLSAVWEFNGLDSDCDQGFVESLVAGTSYLMVEPNPADAQLPFVTMEHPLQCIVEYVPGKGRRQIAAALKVWEDDWGQLLMATLYLPDVTIKVQAPLPKIKRGTTEAPKWEPRQGEDEPIATPEGKVPFFEMPHRPRLIKGGVSELYDLTDSQDRANKTLADRLITQDFGAFPQKWASGFPEEDADGNPQPGIEIGRDRLVQTDATEAKFGQWEAAALDPYSAAKREDVKDIASRSRTPAQYLLGEISNVNGETLKAAEVGLVATVLQCQRYFGEGIRGAMGHVRTLRGEDPSKRIENIWRNPEFRTEGELVDALTKMATLGVPQEALWERWGASINERKRWRQLAEEQAARGGLGDLVGSFAPKPEPSDANAV